MRTPNEMRQFYRNELGPELRRFESYRKTMLLRIVVLAATVVAAVALLFVVFPFVRYPAVALSVPLGFVGLAVAVGIPRTLYVRAFKQQVVARLMSAFDPDIRYNPTRSVSRGEFDDSGLFRTRIDSFRGEDWLQGQLGGHRVTASEVTATRRVGSGKNRRNDIVFKGLFVIVELDRAHGGRTQLRIDQALRLPGGFLGDLLRKLLPEPVGERVELHDPRFAEFHWAVYSTAPDEVPRLFDRPFRDALISLRQEAARDLQLAVVDNRLFVALRTTRDLFEPRILRSVLSYSVVEQFCSDLDLVLRLAQQLAARPPQ